MTAPTIIVFIAFGIACLFAGLFFGSRMRDKANAVQPYDAHTDFGGET